MILSVKQKQYLKSLAHSIKPVVIIGNHGLTQSVLDETQRALQHHELIKIKVNTQDRQIRDQINAVIAEVTNACIVQTIGKMLVLYRFSKEKKITLPGKHKHN